MEKIDTDYKRRNLKSLAKLFKPFNRDWASLRKTQTWRHRPFSTEMFSIHTKTQSQRFYIPPVWRIKSVSEKINLDGKPNRRNKAAISNSSGVVWTAREANRDGNVRHQTTRINRVINI